MKKSLKFIVLASLLIGSAAAGPVRGIFVSATAGMRATYQNHKYTNPSGAVGKNDTLKMGSFFGLGIGLLNQLEKSKAVVGGEVSASLNQSTQRYVLDAGSGAEGNLSVANPYSFGAYGILGMMLTPKAMLYTKAGYAFMRADLKYTNLKNENPNSQTYKKTMSGISGGGGASYLMTDSFLVGIEYLYHRPTAITPRKNDTIQGGQKRAFEYSPTVHSLGLKLSYLF